VNVALPSIRSDLHSSISGLQWTVDELELARLAMRKASPTDRRARVIAVTPAGKRKVAEAKAVTERIQREWLATLAATEQKALLGALEQFLARER